jgi:hypothetical protein
VIVDANEKIDYLMQTVRELQARVDKLEQRQAHAFGELVKPPANGGTLHLPARKT